ncbi:MAG: DUF2330 domain-containing protein [Pseudomonadota bacterium]
MKKILPTLMLGLCMMASGNALAFCGFYVAKADTKLYNKASKVVMVRDEDRTVITMSNDFQGDVKDFAMVIPVPTLLEREQINVASQALIDHLDAYTAPRLVEYFDEDPCMLRRALKMEMADAVQSTMVMEAQAEDLGVTIEASYTVGEYDILILGAEESDGLVQWLTTNGYRLPEGAEAVVGSYLKQGMKFFVAKVNLQQQEALGYASLRPLQVAFESPKFMLPIRLGTLNADGKQDLFVFALTRTGRVETSNYRTVRLPTDIDIPVFIKDRFDDFYRDMFNRQVEKHQGKAVFLEYAWDMAWCDPCAADPLSAAQLRELGVYWADLDSNVRSPAQDVFATRLHVRYDAETFPDDLKFIETGDRTNFQGRYVMRHPWSGAANCEAAKSYFASVEKREAVNASRLINLTGWDKAEVEALLGAPVSNVDDEKWWRRIWKK